MHSEKQLCFQVQMKYVFYFGSKNFFCQELRNELRNKLRMNKLKSREAICFRSFIIYPTFQVKCD